MSIYKPLLNTALDESVIKVPPSATIYNPNPVIIGPRYSPTDSRYYIENFIPARFEPRNIPSRTVDNQGSNFSKSDCPVTPIRLRNEWETFNTTNSVTYGGFDKWNVHDIPSCTERQGGYMNYGDAIKPWGKIMVNSSRNDNDWVIDSHGYGSPYKQPVFKNGMWINQY